MYAILRPPCHGTTAECCSHQFGFPFHFRWEEKVPDAQSGLESAWLLHEIGRCYLELGELEKSREYGEKSLGVAQGIDDNSWILNARVLIAQSEVKQKDYQVNLTFTRNLNGFLKNGNIVCAQVYESGGRGRGCFISKEDKASFSLPNSTFLDE